MYSFFCAAQRRTGEGWHAVCFGYSWSYRTLGGDGMNWKIIVIGGLTFFIVAFVGGFITGFLIHTVVLGDAYAATSSFWRPELRTDPPDMAGLMPEWILNGIVTGFVAAAIYSFIRPAFSGAAWRKGLSFGLLLAAFVAAYHLSLSGYFNLPGKLWGWWSIDALILYSLAGIALGVVADKLAPE